jgi:hypothetical protein
MFKYLIVLFTLISISLNLQSQPTIKLKLNICEWRFKDCGKITIDGDDYKIRAMNTIDYESLHEMTLYTDHKHVVTIQRTPYFYYFTVLYPNGKVECKEYRRDFWGDWYFKLFILP